MLGASSDQMDHLQIVTLRESRLLQLGSRENLTVALNH
jgi:hypothetical protein